MERTMNELERVCKENGLKIIHEKTIVNGYSMILFKNFNVIVISENVLEVDVVDAINYINTSYQTSVNGFNFAAYKVAVTKNRKRRNAV